MNPKDPSEQQDKQEAKAAAKAAKQEAAAQKATEKAAAKQAAAAQKAAQKAAAKQADSEESVLKQEVSFRRKAKDDQQPEAVAPAMPPPPAAASAQSSASGVPATSSPQPATAQAASPAVVKAEVVEQSKKSRLGQTVSLRRRAAKEGKGVQRSIRPIRSRSQQTTSRLIWAVFGMALVIVAVVGFWIVLSSANEEEPTTVEVFVTTRALEVNEFLALDALKVVELEVEGINHVPASQSEDIIGRRVILPVPAEVPLTLGALGGLPEIEGGANLKEFNLSGEIIGNTEIEAGDRVVVLAVPGEATDKFFAVEMVDVFEVGEQGIIIQVSLERRAWWENLVAQYSELDGVSFAFEEVDTVNHPLCWRERYRFVYQIEALSTEEFRALLAELECPPEWLDDALANRPTGGDGGDPFFGVPGTDEPEEEAGSISENLEENRYSSNAPPDDLTDLLATEDEGSTGSGGGGGGGGGIPGFDIGPPPGPPGPGS